MGFFKDFKAFLLKGDIVALATAVVIGAAFNKIISSVVADVLMPIIGVLTGGIAFKQKFTPLTVAGTNPWKQPVRLKLLSSPMVIW